MVLHEEVRDNDTKHGMTESDSFLEVGYVMDFLIS